MQRAIGMAAGMVLAVALWTGLAAASGTGPVSVNTSSTSATSNNSVLRWSTASGVRQVTCGNLSLSTIQISSSGSIVIPRWSAAFVNCQYGSIAITMTQTLAWSGQLRHLDDDNGDVTAVTFDLVIPRGGWAVSRPGCTFTQSGTLLSDFRMAASLLHGTLFTIPGRRFPASLGSGTPTMVIEAPVGLWCLALGFRDGDTFGMAANFSFSGTGVNLAGLR